MIDIIVPRAARAAVSGFSSLAPAAKGSLAQQIEAWDRRRFLTGLGMGSLYFLTPGLYAQALVTTPAQTEGPYYPPNLPLDVNNDLVILGNNLTPAAGTISYISGRVLTSSGDPVPNAVVEIWQADNNGAYIHPNSPILPRDANFQGFGEFLTDSQGRYLFRTILPGLYPGRTRHVHVKVRTFGGQSLTTQLYIQGVAQNAGDGILNGIPSAQRANVLVPWNPLPGSPVGALWAQWDIVLSYTPNTSSPAEAVLPQPIVYVENATVDGAGFQPQIVVGSWASVFGMRFAEVSRDWNTETEIVNGKFPTSLEGVSVQVGGVTCYMSYISPGQINFQVPAGLSAGTHELVVTTPNGVSAPVDVVVVAYRPEFFRFPQDYVAAVRPSGNLVAPNGVFDGIFTTPAAAGETLMIYGTGFGATTPSVPPGEVFEGAAPLANDVVVRIGGQLANVSFAGLAGAGLYQFNVDVPELAAGEYSVTAEIGGVTTETTAKLAVG